MFYPGFPGDRAGGKTYGLIFIREYAPQGAGMAARAAEWGAGRSHQATKPAATGSISRDTFLRGLLEDGHSRWSTMCEREEETIASSLPFLLGQKFASQVGVNSSSLAVVPA